MPLPAGTRIGGYEIVALIGAGGMGEVYRARDARLGRDVAIKVVSPSIAGDADGLQRFEREARALASLNHPNIAAIYGVDDSGGFPALILELVEGETLADRIAGGPIPVSEALACARQIAEALDAAHEAGIVHRDLKPGNIKITDAGTVKVLDFGLAKAIAAASLPDPAVDPSNSPTVTLKGTQGGIILGTAAYMSPEQARGKAIDKRTDIWAFGCVLYEMLTRERPFDGETTSDVIAAIIERMPDLSKLPAAVPPHVRRVIGRCLEKDPKRRARDIAEVRLQLDGESDARTQAAPRRRPLVVASGVAAALLVAAGYVGWRNLRNGPVPSVPLEFTFAAPAGTLEPWPPSPSPDGRYIAFIARDQTGTSVWVRSLDAATPRKLDGTDGASGRVSWSPDSRSLAFVSGTMLKRVPIEGGPVLTIMPSVANLGSTWGADDTLLVAPVNRGPIMRISASGGTPTPVTRLDTTKENSHRWPQFLPDGRHFLFTTRSDKPENQGIKLGSVESGEIRPLINVASPGIYVSPGWILYVTPEAVLMAQPFDAATLTLTGTPQPVAANVRYSGPSAQAFFGAAADGSTLAYLPMPRGGSRLMWFDRSGHKVGETGPERRYVDVRLSPDGRRVALVIPDERYGTRDIWVLDLATDSLTRLTSNPATDWRAVWSPDGATMLFASDRSGASAVFRTSPMTSGVETLFYRAASGAFPSDWSRDGKSVLLHQDAVNGASTTMLLADVEGRTTPLVEKGPYRINFGRFSPDGSQIAYQSDPTGGMEIYVRSMKDHRQTRVSVDGGVQPVWGRDARELFYSGRDGAVMAAALDAGTLRTPPLRLFMPCRDTAYPAFTAEAVEIGFDFDARTNRFLVRCDSADTIPAFATVAVNWQNKLR